MISEYWVWECRGELWKIYVDNCDQESPGSSWTATPKSNKKTKSFYTWIQIINYHYKNHILVTFPNQNTLFQNNNKYGVSILLKEKINLK